MWISVPYAATGRLAGCPDGHVTVRVIHEQVPVPRQELPRPVSGVGRALAYWPLPGEDSLDISLLQKQRQFHVHQRVTMMVNRYEVFADVDGQPGELLAFVEQKRMTFKEQVTLYTDESKRDVLAAFKARKVIDLASAYDVTAPDGQVIGVFSKKFGKSLLRSTWQLDQPGVPQVVIAERSKGMALFRRIWDFIPWIGDLPFPWKYHFDFVREGDGTPVGQFEKKTRFRDHYVIRIDDDALDRRLMLSLGVALDALQSR